MYEEEFKKLDIDKLFNQFNRKKMRHSPDEIKVFKSELEKKMSKREFLINEFYRKLQDDEIKGKSIRFKIYKKLGYVKEEKEETRTYDQIVNEEINNIKNKNTHKEEIKKEKEDIIEEEKKKELALRKLMFFFVGFYFISIGIFFLSKSNREKLMKQQLIDNKKKEESDRLKSYQYFG
mgnify:CR=1 FL=1